MITLSCRASRIMPDGYTTSRWDLDKFGDLVELTEDGPVPPRLSLWPKNLLFDFEGFNREQKGWRDSTMDQSHNLESRLRQHNLSAEFVACLWPCGDSALSFGKARDRAEHAAKRFYAPMIYGLVTSGYQVSLVGHSCGGAMVYWIAEYLANSGAQCNAAILMNAAIRQSEVKPEAKEGAKRWLNLYSEKDSALWAMQRSLVDEHGGFWKGVGAWITGKNQRNELLVGKNGLPWESVINDDLTDVIHAAHSDAFCLPRRGAEMATMEKVVKLLTLS